MPFIDESLITTDFVKPFSRNGVSVYTLRTDKIHPIVSGNKWFKLKYYLQEAQAQNKKYFLTFGGAYSNHIVATAAACRQIGLKSVGMIRGEKPEKESHTLRDARHYGMELFFISREDYKNKKLPEKFFSNDYYIVREGGYGNLGAAGAATIFYEKEKFDVICCAVGTGTMMAGLINAKKQNAAIVGISVLKNNFSLENEVRQLLLDSEEKINIIHDYHFGGYAKYNQTLIDFMNQFYETSRIPTDFVYTGKLFYAVNDLIEKKYFARGSNMLIIHCGGLQGNFSLPKGILRF
jgi:1-aminocyclopropane-1-carboxylate deaminase